MDVPPGAACYIRHLDGGRAWLQRAPVLIEECLSRWRLKPGTPYPNSAVSVVIPVVRSNGEVAVLKVQFPHRESANESDALRLWDGNGAICLLDYSEDLNALLVERCHPGTPLSTQDPDIALSVLASLMERTWLPDPEGFTCLAEEAALWISHLKDKLSEGGISYERRLAELAVETIEVLVDSDQREVLVHQDLHGENVLSAEREPWLIIDPKPLRAEPAFGLAPVINSYEFGHSRQQVHRRVNVMVDAMGVDRDRAVGWAFARTIAWAGDGPSVNQRHIDTATWLAELL